MRTLGKRDLALSRQSACSDALYLYLLQAGYKRSTFNSDTQTVVVVINTYFDAAKFSIKLVSLVDFSVSVVRQRDEYEIVTEIIELLSDKTK